MAYDGDSRCHSWWHISRKTRTLQKPWRRACHRSHFLCITVHFPSLEQLRLYIIERMMLVLLPNPLHDNIHDTILSTANFRSGLFKSLSSTCPEINSTNRDIWRSVAIGNIHEIGDHIRDLQWICILVSIHILIKSVWCISSTCPEMKF